MPMTRSRRYKLLKAVDDNAGKAKKHVKGGETEGKLLSFRSSRRKRRESRSAALKDAIKTAKEVKKDEGIERKAEEGNGEVGSKRSRSIVEPVRRRSGRRQRRRMDYKQKSAFEGGLAAIIEEKDEEEEEEGEFSLTRVESMGSTGSVEVPSTPVLRRSGASELVTMVRRLKRENARLRRASGKGEDNLAAEVHSLRAASAEATASLAHATAEAAQAQREARELQEKLNEQRGELRRLEAKLASASAAKSESLAAMEKKLRKEQEERRGEVERIQKEKEDALERVGQLEEQMQQLEEKIAALEQELSTKAREVDQVREKAEKETAMAVRARHHAEARLEHCDARRSFLQERVLDLQGAIRVLVRSRPLLSSETPNADQVEVCSAAEAAAGATASSRRRRTKPTSSTSSSATLSTKTRALSFPHAADGEACFVEVAKPRGGRARFRVDHAFGPTAAQAEVFAAVRGLVSSALDGKRACIFAYGATGAGKTHTMMGPTGIMERVIESMNAVGKDDDCGASPDATDALPMEAGVIPRAFADVFARRAQLMATGWSVRVFASYVEIYNDEIFDLAAPASASTSSSSSSSSSTSLSTRLDRRSGEMLVEGVVEEEMENLESVASFVAAAGARRSVHGTRSNAQSSRSHAVVRLRFEMAREGDDSRHGQLQLIDLAGSERVEVSGSVDDPARLKEAQNINKSLSALGMVLRALARKHGEAPSAHVPFRDSTLTKLLQPALQPTVAGCSCRALMVVNLDPRAVALPDTLAALRFAKQIIRGERGEGE